MWNKAALLSSLIAVAGTVTAGVDLTPSPVQVDDDGVKYQQLRFKSRDGGSVLFTPPQGWSFSGGGGRLVFKPPGKDFAEAVLETVPLPAPAPIDEAVRNEFKEQVVATLPPGSQSIATVAETENAIMPAGNPSFEVVVSYQLMGKTFQRSALLVHTPRERLLFRVTAQKADYMSLANEFGRSAMTWLFIEAKPAEGAAPPVN